jgi:hypothetical protein
LGLTVRDHAKQIDILLSGPQHEWTDLDDEMVAGEGVYGEYWKYEKGDL